MNLQTGGLNEFAGYRFADTSDAAEPMELKERTSYAERDLPCGTDGKG